MTVYRPTERWQQLQYENAQQQRLLRIQELQEELEINEKLATYLVDHEQAVHNSLSELGTRTQGLKVYGGSL